MKIGIILRCGRTKYASQSGTTCDHAERAEEGSLSHPGSLSVWRYPPTSEWITGRTIYSKPLSGGALQIYERRRPFNRLAQSSLTAVVKPPYPACLPRLSPLLSRGTLSLRRLPRLGSAWLPPCSHVSPLFYTEASRSDLVLILKGMARP